MKYPLFLLDIRNLPQDVLDEVPRLVSRHDMSALRFDEATAMLIEHVKHGSSLKKIMDEAPTIPRDTLTRIVSLFETGILRFSPGFMADYIRGSESESTVPPEYGEDGKGESGLDETVSAVMGDVPASEEDGRPTAAVPQAGIEDSRTTAVADTAAGEDGRPTAVAEPDAVAEGRPTPVVEPAPDQESTTAAAAERVLEAEDSSKAADSAQTPVQDVQAPETGATTPAAAEEGADAPAGTAQAATHDATATPAEAEEKPQPSAASSGLKSSGSIEDTSTIDIFEKLLAARFSGRVAFSDQDGEAEIYFDGGHPAFLVSRRQGDDIGTLLYQDKKIDSRKYEMYKRDLRRDDSNPEKIMIERRIVDRPKLRFLRVWRTRKIIENFLGLTKGNFEIQPGAQPPENLTRTKLNLRNLLATSWRKVALTDKRRKFIDDNLVMYMLPSAKFDQITENMNFDDREVKIIEALRHRPYSVRKIFSISTLYSNHTYLLVDRLLSSGAVELKEEDTSAHGPAEVSRLKYIADSMKTMNFFERLSAHPVSTPGEIEKHYKEAKLLFNAGEYRNISDEHRQSLKAINELVKEAYDTLKDNKERRKYREENYSMTQLKMFADIQMKKGIVELSLRSAHDFAIELLESAFDVLPTNAECMVNLADAYSRKGENRNARELLDRARILPVPAFLVAHMASIYAGMGNLTMAHQLAEKARKQAPNDPKVKEFLADLKRAE